MQQIKSLFAIRFSQKLILCIGFTLISSEKGLCIKIIERSLWIWSLYVVSIVMHATYNSFGAHNLARLDQGLVKAKIFFLLISVWNPLSPRTASNYRPTCRVEHYTNMYDLQLIPGRSRGRPARKGTEGLRPMLQHRDVYLGGEEETGRHQLPPFPAIDESRTEAALDHVPR